MRIDMLSHCVKQNSANSEGLEYQNNSRRAAEQKSMINHGDLENLENKRNEIASIY